jgi:hypothetical protein
MSALDVGKAVRGLQEQTVDVLWRQWGALGAPTSHDLAHSLIDPEALVLASLALRDAERRLPDVLRWWARTGATLLSVTRMRSLARRFPDAIRGPLGEFAATAVREGRDFRWRPLAHPSSSLTGRPKKDLGAVPRFLTPPALPLRLRLGFGVTVKADLLATLLGSSDGWLSVKRIAASLGYTPQSVRRAGDDLVAARLIQVSGETPTGYRAEPARWVGLLSLPESLPPWRHWTPAFAFVAVLGEWVRKHDGSTASSNYLLSTQARDLVAAHQSAFVQNRLSIPRPEDSPGETYLTAFRDTLAILEAWLDENG